MNFKSIIMLCIGIIAATAIASIDKIQPLINDRNIIQLENGNVRLGKVYEERLNTDYTVTDSNGKEVFSITSPTPNIYLITIETQPASTGVVALEPYDSRS